MTTNAFIVPPCHDAIAICHRDDDLLVVEKPAGLLSVPGRHPQNRDCLISRLQQTDPSAMIVHRLDMATSGLMIVALHKDAHRALSRLFEQRQVDKTYIARVAGRVAADSGLVDLPLACDWPRRPRQQVNFDYGKAAQTRFRTLQRDHRSSLLRLNPVTGRSHQLRVHCASIGHPILGCEFYADADARSAAPRLLLHASGLQFRHPRSGALLKLESPAHFD